MHSQRNETFVPAGTTSTNCTRSIEDFERYLKENLSEIFEFGMKIRNRNIFYVLLMKDKKTGQVGFSIMLGDRTVIDYFTKEKET